MTFFLFVSFFPFSPFLQLNRVNGPPSPQPTPGNTGRVAAVGPYIQVPVPGRQEGYVVPPEPLKPQSLVVNTPANHARSKSGQSINTDVCMIMSNIYLEWNGAK